MAERTSFSGESECEYLTVGEAKKLITIAYVLAVIASIACIVTILIILILKAYRQYTHRLALYLACISLLLAMIQGLEVVPVDTGGAENSTISLKNGWDGACIAFGFMVQYAILSTNLAIAWVCFYIFMLAVFKIQLNQVKHEVIGLVTISFLPALLSWEPFVGNEYGLTGIWCWIKSSCNGTDHLGVAYQNGLTLGPVALMSIFSLLSVLMVVVMFCKRALTHAGHLQYQHWIAMKELLPLLIYPTLFSLASIVDLVQKIYFATAGKKKHPSLAVTSDITLFQALIISLPLSLLLQPHILSRLRCRTKGRRADMPTQRGSITYHQTVPPTVQTSTTCHIVPPDSLCTEIDPLIVK